MVSTLVRSTILLLATTAVATAGVPALENHAAKAMTVNLPKGWKVTINEGGATIFVAQQDPARPDAAALLVTVQMKGNASTEDQLLDVVVQQVAKDVKASKREAITGGGHLLIADGMAGTIKVRVGAIAIASGESAILGVLVAKTGEFDGLGGITTVTSVLGSLKLAQPVQPAPGAPAAPPPTASGGRPTAVADLAGVWETNGSSTQQYSNSSGGYAGASSVALYKQYTIAANGDYTEKFRGYSGGTATGNGTFAGQTYTGKFTLDANGTLSISVKGSVPDLYVIKSWTQTADQTTIVVGGPYWGHINQMLIDNPNKSCPCETWVRKSVKK